MTLLVDTSVWSLALRRDVEASEPVSEYIRAMRSRVRSQFKGGRSKAEAAAAKITDDKEKGRATAMLDLAKQWNKEAAADHKEAGAKKSAELHYRAEAKAKAAKALADEVK